MKFTQGDIIWSDFPKDGDANPQKTIIGRHPSLLLHDDSHDNQTVILAPLSSLYDREGNKKDTKSYHLIVYSREYKGLPRDSYVKLDQIMTFSRNRIDGDYICTLNEKDIAAAHIKIIESLQMHDTIRDIVFKRVEETVYTLIEEYKNINGNK